MRRALLSSMNATTRSNRKSRKFTPAAWQWDPLSVCTAGLSVQVWSASGCLQANVTEQEAREMVASKAYFAASCIHICQVHDGIVTP